jgi:class 3 adenylate cyclase/tetratricopeptide (TPR) repeat protein
VDCPTCSTPNPPGRKFCSQCGARLALPCPACGEANQPGDRFCGECGAGLAEDAPAQEASSLPSSAERRLVSVLFCDLVNFTSFSEHRDAEDVREFLTGYFELAQDIVQRFGGTVDKFIGDAVMGVWGARMAREDDAERAVRAALELVDGVSKLGAEAGVPELALRAGVLTGEAAVGPGGNREGLVVGDLVNTASRLQAIAPAGSVLVGESTYRATHRAIDFEELGEHEIKGKSLPVAAWRALRVVARRGGQGRAAILEGPFVGRGEELRLIKDLLHATERERRPRLLSIVGIAGIGKSRLIQEFLNYVDGLAEDVYWHEGRSPAYGEGVTFWALGEMVRRRAGIAETEESGAAAEKLAETVAEYVRDEEEQRRLLPRLSALLGLAEMPAGERAELFSAWRTFFERVSARGTTVLVFEDLQWADPGLLDFIEELPEWSREKPILVVTLARPDLLDRRASWGAGRRHFVSLHLGPLPDQDMAELVAGLAPGLPEEAATLIMERAAGVPLYAVELVRMLLLEGDLVPEDGRYRLVRSVSELAVPESLLAVIGARLDALDPADRGLLQEAAVLGQSFTISALGALGEEPAGLEPRLGELVRKELLAIDVDPRSPERGQYGFVQGLIREVAYARLGRHERRALHLQAAGYFERLGDDELAAIVANHYLEAHRAGPADSDDLAERAAEALQAAAERAASLHSHQQALALSEQALQVPIGPARRARLFEQAAESAFALAGWEAAELHARAAIEEYRSLDDRMGAARGTRLLGTILMTAGHAARAAEILEAGLEEWEGEQPNEAFAGLATDLARAYQLSGDGPRAVEMAERALIASERLEIVPFIAQGLITRGTALGDLGRLREGVALLREALRLAEGHELAATELRARANLAYLLFVEDPQEVMKGHWVSLEKARTMGDRSYELFFATNAAGTLNWMGRWEEARKLIAEYELDELPMLRRADLEAVLAHIDVMEGDLNGGRRRMEEVMQWAREWTDPQHLRGLDIERAWIAFAGGRIDEAYQIAVERARQDPFGHASMAWTAVHASLWSDDKELISEALALLDQVQRRGRFIRALRTLLEAGMAAVEGEVERAVERFSEVAGELREMGLTRDLALSRAESALLLGLEHPEGARAAEEARALFGELGARAFSNLLEERLKL